VRPLRFVLVPFLVGVARLFAADGLPPPAPSSGPAEIITALRSAWNARDISAFLAPWSFSSPEQEAAERAFASGRLGPGKGDSRLTLYVPPSVGPAVKRVLSYGEIITINEPWGRVEQVLVRLEKSDAGVWTVASEEVLDRLDGLAHLSLDPHGLTVNGQVLRLPDFELTMKSGTLFTSPDTLGRTVLVFAGEGRVHFQPEPPVEREQLRKYCGRAALDRDVHLAFVRVSPGDLGSILTGVPLEHDAQAGSRWGAAQKFYQDNVESVYLVDAPVPGSPWWVVPPSGDAVVVFDYGNGPVTLSVNSARAEGVSLFDRPRARQICLYPLPGRPRDFEEGADRRFDLLHIDARMTLDPANDRIVGEAKLRLRLDANPGTIKLHLADALNVDSVSSEDGRQFLFFRLRRMNTLVVALGGLRESSQTTFIVRYHGTLKLPPFERESTSPVDPPPEPDTSSPLPTPPLVYGQPTAWYPQAESDEFATGTFQVDVPSEFNLVGPGKRTVAPGGSGRTVYRFVAEQPMKQFVLVLGRLADGGSLTEGGVTLSAFTTPRLRGAAAETLAMAARIVRLYTQEFGPCPYHEVQIVLLEGSQPGGHSPPGVALLVRKAAALHSPKANDPGNFSDQPGFFLAHELAHQWWGDGVAPASYHDCWMSEAIAHYAAALWIRHSRGDDVFRDVIRDMEEWGIDKTDAGPISLGYRIGHLEGDSRLYRAVVYDKGACVLHMTRALLGDAAFRRGLTAFQETYRFKSAGTRELRETLERSGELSLKPYFESWFYGTEIAKLAVSWHTQPRAEGGFETSIKVKAEHLPAAIPVQVTLEGDHGDVVRTETVTPDGREWQVETSERPHRVRLNRDAGLLARISD
jgi:hypothetical protein